MWFGQANGGIHRHFVPATRSDFAGLCKKAPAVLEGHLSKAGQTKKQSRIH